MSRLVVIRGLPGSGKSTLAKRLREIGYVHVEADMYHLNDEGEYVFDKSKIKDAHEWCQRECARLLESGHDVVVSNTTVNHQELYPYCSIAEQGKHELICLVAHGNYGSIHNVPQESIDRMISKWESVGGEFDAEKWVKKEEENDLNS